MKYRNNNEAELTELTEREIRKCRYYPVYAEREVNEITQRVSQSREIRVTGAETR